MAESTINESSDRSVSERLLYDSSGARLRALWRVLVPLLVAVTIYAVGQSLVNRFAASLLEPIADGTSRVVATAILFIVLSAVIALAGVAGLLVASRLDRRPLSSYGFDVSGRWLREFAAGILIGVVAAAGAIGYLAARGDVALSPSVTGVGVDSPLLSGIVVLVLMIFFLANNAFEEIVFRAIVIGTAVEGFRSSTSNATAAVVGAVVVSLPVFGALHLLGGGPMAVATSAIGGILFATAYVLTGELALPIGVHFGGVAVLSIRQQPVSTDPELTLPSLVVTELTGDPSFLTSIELWTVRLLLGVALICLWVYATDGEVSIADRVLATAVDSER